MSSKVLKIEMENRWDCTFALDLLLTAASVISRMSFGTYAEPFVVMADLWALPQTKIHNVEQPFQVTPGLVEVWQSLDFQFPRVSKSTS